MSTKSEQTALRFNCSLRQVAALHRKNAEELGQMALTAKRTKKKVNSYTEAQLRAMVTASALRYEWTEMLAHNEELRASRADRSAEDMKYFDAHAADLRTLLNALDTPRAADPFAMKVASVGNADMGQFHGEGQSAPTLTVEAADLATLRAVLMAYITVYDLGGGNMARGCGDVYKGGALVARISYNGRVWTPEEFPKCREIDAATGNVMAAASA